MSDRFSRPTKLAIREGCEAGVSEAVIRILAGPEALGVIGPIGSYDAGNAPYDTIGSAAIIEVNGTLVDKLGYWGSSWATGYDALAWQMDTAFKDDAIKGIVLSIDSGGGYIEGLFELLAWIEEAKSAAGKQILSACSPVAFSAAYALATVGDQISVPMTGGVGSIGVLQVHAEFSKWFEQEGDTYTIMRAGANKADVNSYEPLPADAKARIETELAALRVMFAEVVVKNRKAAGVEVALDQVLGTEALAYDGPISIKTALGLGLADAILPADQAIAGFVEFLSEA